MLEIRPNCEHCGKHLPNDSKDAMICTFECTFCLDCAKNILFNVCPNCGGGFEKRPSRPFKLLQKYPVSNSKILNPINVEKFKLILNQYKSIEPNKR
ncbi:MAG: DUF1272 domain-containing protein [Saprospiraceae bacterium]